MCWALLLSFSNLFELKIVWFELWAAASKKKRVGADTKKVGQAKKESGGRYKKVVASKKRERCSNTSESRQKNNESELGGKTKQEKFVEAM